MSSSFPDRRPAGPAPDLKSAASTLVGSTAYFGTHHGRAKRFRAGRVLSRQGEPVEAVFRIRHGLVKLMTYLRGGEARIVRLQRAGDWLGLEGLLREPWSHTAIALGRVTVERYPLQSVAPSIQDDAEALNGLLVQWHRDLAAADMWIAEFSTGTVRRRVLRLIGYLARLEEVDSGRVHLPTVREMGEILGVRPESVSRVVAGLKRSSVLVPAGRGRPEAYRVNARKLALLRGVARTRPGGTRSEERARHAAG